MYMTAYNITESLSRDKIICKLPKFCFKEISFMGKIFEDGTPCKQIDVECKNLCMSKIRWPSFDP